MATIYEGFSMYAIWTCSFTKLLSIKRLKGSKNQNDVPTRWLKKF